MNISSLSSGLSGEESAQDLSRVKTFSLPDKYFDKRVACTWRRGNKLTIYPGSHKTSKKPSENLENIIINIQQQILLFSPILRKLVNESNGTFLALQKVAEANKNNDNQVEYLKLSRQYRSIIRVCIENLQEAAQKATDGVEKNSIQSCVTIFYSIECVWHLCEILYIDNIPGDVVLPFLLEWVRFHFPCYEQTAAQLLEACERGSEEHEQYWDTVIGMIVQGRVDVARSLLKLHSVADSNEFRLVENSLRTMPVYNVYGGVSLGDFTISWKHWQAECRSKLASHMLASQPQLELIMKLIVGEYSAFEAVRGKFSAWHDMVGGWALYRSPAASRGELRAAAVACAGLRPSPRSRLDHMLLALMDGDLHQVIHEIQQVADNGWFATHLADLLHHCGRLRLVDQQQNDISSRLRDSLVLEYGSTLFEHQSLWSAGLGYLAAAHGGQARAAALLERVPPRTDAKAMRLVAEARKHGLLSVVQTISATLSSSRASMGRYGAALAWAVRGRSARGAAAAAHRALKQYAAGGGLPAADLLLTAGPNMLMADALVFLGKYCDFHRMYKGREFKKAAKLLVSLITSKIAPDYFWETLLVDTLPLLESDEPVFSSKDTFEIMLCLELRSASLSEEKAELLRLATARNLARTSLADVEDV